MSIPAETGDPPIADLPVNRGLHQRLLRGGAAALSDAEIVAILLDPGSSECTALRSARELLTACGGLAGLVGVTLERLHALQSRPTASVAIFAAVELGLRLAKARVPTREPMSHPGAVARYLSLRYGKPGQEVMGALYLDSRNRLLAEGEIYRGTLNRAAVEPRALLKEGLLRDAAGLVVFHTHPSGDPSPSPEDLAFTRRVARSGELLGLRLIDHLILGQGDRFVSLRQRGGW